MIMVSGMADLLVDYFASVFTEDDLNKPLPDCPRLEAAVGFECVEFSTEKIVRAINTFRWNTSPGADCITATVLRRMSDVVAPILGGHLH